MPKYEQTSLFTDSELSNSDSINIYPLKDSSFVKSLQQLKLGKPQSQFINSFATILSEIDGWHSYLCELTWRGKDMKSNRFIFHLNATQVKTLLRTPTADESGVSVERLVSKDGGQPKIGERVYDKDTGRLAQIGLSQQVQMMSNSLLPTPTLQDARIGINNIGGSQHRAQRGSVALADIALGLTEMLPTPTAYDWNSARHAELWEKDKKKYADKGINLHCSLRQKATLGLLPTPTLMDSTNSGDMTAAAKMMKGATHRSSGQPIQKSLTMKVHEAILEQDPELADELAQRKMEKRENLPTQQEFVTWIRSVTKPKELSEKSNIKLTTVEHWFRKDDNGFSYPSIEEWLIIREFLNPSKELDRKMTETTSIEWKGMLPTPSTSDTQGSPKRPDSIQKTESGWIRKSDNTGTTFGAKLSDVAPIISGHEYKRGKPARLSPHFVLEMMGFPTDWTLLPFLKNN